MFTHKLAGVMGFGRKVTEVKYHFHHIKSGEVLLLQEGGPLPGPNTGLSSNTWK